MDIFLKDPGRKLKNLLFPEITVPGCICRRSNFNLFAVSLTLLTTGGS